MTANAATAMATATETMASAMVTMATTATTVTADAVAVATAAVTAAVMVADTADTAVSAETIGLVQQTQTLTTNRTNPSKIKGSVLSFFTVFLPLNIYMKKRGFFYIWKQRIKTRRLCYLKNYKKTF